MARNMTPVPREREVDIFIRLQYTDTVKMTVSGVYCGAAINADDNTIEMSTNKSGLAQKDQLPPARSGHGFTGPKQTCLGSGLGCTEFRQPGRRLCRTLASKR